MTPLSAATAGDDNTIGILVLVGLVLLVTVLYAGSCLLFPFTDCRSCKGTARHSRKDGKVWRDCRRCKATGKRLRFGRAVWNYLRRTTS